MPQELSVVKRRERFKLLLLSISDHLEDVLNLQLIHGVCGTVCVLDVVGQTLELVTIFRQNLEIRVTEIKLRYKSKSCLTNLRIQV